MYSSDYLRYVLYCFTSDVADVVKYCLYIVSCSVCYYISLEICKILFGTYILRYFCNKIVYNITVYLFRYQYLGRPLFDWQTLTVFEFSIKYKNDLVHVPKFCVNFFSIIKLAFTWRAEAK